MVDHGDVVPSPGHFPHEAAVHDVVAVGVGGEDAQDARRLRGLARHHHQQNQHFYHIH